ncbi:MAG: hypothetical protein MUO24_02300 [Desulfobacterales bacterium]|nr:hypothetical protein [Desulfobacterales bacterium]
MKRFLPLALLLLLLSVPAWGGGLSFPAANHKGTIDSPGSGTMTKGRGDLVVPTTEDKKCGDKYVITGWDTYQRVNKAGDALEEISADSMPLQTLSFPFNTPLNLTLTWPDCKDITIIVKGPECDIFYEIRGGEIVLIGRRWKEPRR